MKDLQGNTVFPTNFNADGTFPPCDNNRTVANTPNGIGQFTIHPNGGSQIEGNTSVFNICATTGNPVPTKVTSRGQSKANYK